MVGTHHYITTTYNSDNSITISGTPDSNWAYVTNEITQTLPIGTYTLCVTEKLNFNFYIAVTYNDNSTANFIVYSNTYLQTFTTTKPIIKYRVILSGMTSGTTYNKTTKVMLASGTDTNFSPYVENPIQLEEDDTIQKVEGEWCVNETPIDNEYLTTQLDNLQSIALYEGINYIDWIGKFKATMLLKYFSDQEVEFEEITTHDYKANSFKHANEYYGGLNRVGYGDSDIEGQEEYVENAADIEDNGLKDLFINDNAFAYTEAKRQALVLAGRKLLGFKYMPIQELLLKGLIYLDCTDYLKIIDADDTELYSRCFDHIIQYQGYVADTIRTIAQATNEQTYENINSSTLANTRTQVIVDKANKKITLVAEDTEEALERTSELEVSVDGISSTVNALTDVSVDAESSVATVSFENVNTSEPIGIKVHPLVSPGIKCIYPSSSLYPSSTLFMIERIIRFTRTYEEDGETKTQDIDYQLPADLLYYDSTHYDEFELDYNNNICKIIKRCEYNSSGSIVPLSQEQEIEYEYPEIILLDGNYTITIPGYNVGYLYVKLMKQNPYTSQFTTQVQTKSEIQVTAEGISSEVATKVGENEIISKINQSAEQIQINADKISIEGKEVNFTTSIVNQYTYSSNDLTIIQNYLMGEGSLTLEQIETYDVDGDGLISPADYVIISNAINNNNGVIEGKFSIDPYSTTKSVVLTNKNNETKTYVGLNGIASGVMSAGTLYADSFYLGTQNVTTDTNYVFGNENWIEVNAGMDNAMISADEISVMNLSGSVTSSVITANSVTTPQVIQTSKEEDKKNFEKYENALKEVLDTDIYKYNLKFEEDSDKKHIGFIIGDKFKHSKDITNEKDGEETGVDLYSMIAVSFKAIQEQQKMIQLLQKEIKELKKGEK